MKWIKKLLKWFMWLLVIAIVAFNLAIVFTGRFYVYKGIANTYLVGELQPTIYDLDVFHNRKVPAADPQPWIESPILYTLDFTKEERELVESLDPASFLVLHGDTLIYEEYWNEHHQHTVSNSFSGGKSVISLLIGVAIEEGKIKSLDEPVANYLEEFNDEKKDITIRHVITMSTGLSWSESYYSPFTDVAELYYDTDARDLSLNRRTIEEPPGEIHDYKSGDTQVLLYVLQEAVGMSASEYASEKLWKPMGAESDAFWSLTGDENSAEKAFCCMYATSRDFLRLGRLVNNKGNWKGEQLVPESYVEEFMTLAPLKTREGEPNLRYGYQYWLYTGFDFTVGYFRGMRGQFIISVPEKDLVIVRTGGKTQPNWVNTETEKHDELVGHYSELDDYVKIGLRMIESY
ncbi:MAG: beta-lactamase family protein [Crocinitomicaceae bacterium]|nr:beta-lactamase family protein [Crocinitomicaceae bacterium]